MRSPLISIAIALVAFAPLALQAAEPAASKAAAATQSAATTQATPAAKPDEAGNEFFERKIRPLLAQHCYSCHARGEKKGGLSLDTREGLLAGGESGAVAVPGKPEESLLIEAVSYAATWRCRPKAS